MGNPWNNKKGNRGSVIVGPLNRGERHEISTTDIEAGEWLNLRNVTPTKRGLRKESGFEAANDSGSNTATGAVQLFQRLDRSRNYASAGQADGFVMNDGRDGWLPSKFAWSSMGSSTGRNIVITVAANTLSATIAGTYITGGVTYAFNFDTSFMLEPGDRIFDPLNPSATSLIETVTATTITFAAGEHNVPNTTTTLNIIYKWQSSGYPVSLGYYVDIVQLATVPDTGRASGSLETLNIPSPVLVTSSLGRPMMFSAAGGAKTKLSDQNGFEGLLSLRDGGASGFSHYPLDADQVVKAWSARTIEAFRGFLYAANTRELTAVPASSVPWAGIAANPSGVYVAIASGSNAATVSVDGSSWANVTLPASGSWCKPIWSTVLGAFLAIANGSSTGIRSANGSAWTTFTLPGSFAWTGITELTALGAIVCSIGSSATAYFSVDLSAWTSFTGAATAHAFLAYPSMPTRTVAAGTGTAADLIVPVKAISEGATVTPARGAYNQIAYDAYRDVFVLASTRSDQFGWNIFTAPGNNPSTLTSVGSTPTSGGTAITAIENTALIVDPVTHNYTLICGKLTSSLEPVEIFVSTNGGVTWVQKYSSVAGTTRAGAVSSTGIIIYFAASLGIISSTDGGQNWTLTASLPFSDVGAMTYDTTNNRFIIVAYSGTNLTFYTSTNGTSWTAPGGALAFAGNITAAVWSTRLATLAVSTSTKVYTTTNLTAMTEVLTVAGAAVKIHWCPYSCVFYIENSTNIIYSDNGTYWWTVATGLAYSLAGMSATNPSNGTSVHVPANAKHVHGVASLKGKSITLAAALTHRSAAWSSDLSIFAIIASGSTNGGSSPDGVTWTQRTLPSSATWVDIAVTSLTNKFVAIASGGTAGAYSTNGTSWSASTLPASSTWSGVAFGGAVIAVANGTTAGAKSTNGSTWSANALAPAPLLTQFGTRIRWSLSSDPRNFTNPTNYIDIPEQSSQIIKLLSDGERLMAYLGSTIYYAVSTGDSVLPFTFLKLETGGIGLAAQLAVCRVRNAHVFVGKHNVYVIDNLSITAIGDPIVDVVVRKLSNTLITQCYYNEARNIVVFGFAVDNASYIDQIWHLNIDTKAWSCARTGLTLTALAGYYANSMDGIWAHRTMITDNAGISQLQSAETTADTTPFVMETGDLSFENSDNATEYFRLKLNIDENEFGATRAESIVFAVSLSTDFGKTYKQIPGVLRIPVGQQEGYINFRAISNYIRFRFTSTSNVAPYTVTSYTIDMKLMAPYQTLNLSGGKL